MDVHVRGMNPGLWRELRLEAVRQDISVAKLIEQLWAPGNCPSSNCIEEFGPHKAHPYSPPLAHPLDRPMST